jgi:hypothetical protein
MILPERLILKLWENRTNIIAVSRDHRVVLAARLTGCRMLKADFEVLISRLRPKVNLTVRDTGPAFIGASLVMSGSVSAVQIIESGRVGFPYA